MAYILKVQRQQYWPMEDTADFNTQVPKGVEQLGQSQGGDSLINRGVDDVFGEGYTVPEQWLVGQGLGNMFAEMHRGETIKQRIRQKQPEVARDGTPWNPDGEEHQVGRERAGWLVWVQGSSGENTLEVDVEFFGGMASTEETVAHTIRDNQGEDDGF